MLPADVRGTTIHHGRDRNILRRHPYDHLPTHPHRQGDHSLTSARRTSIKIITSANHCVDHPRPRVHAGCSVRHRFRRQRPPPIAQYTTGTPPQPVIHGQRSAGIGHGARGRGRPGAEGTINVTPETRAERTLAVDIGLPHLPSAPGVLGIEQVAVKRVLLARSPGDLPRPCEPSACRRTTARPRLRRANERVPLPPLSAAASPLSGSGV